MSKIKKRFLDFEIYEQAEVDTLITTTSGDIVEQIVTDHGELTGLTDDDHTQYLLADGTRQLSGTWDYGSQTISGSGDIKTSSDYVLCGSATSYIKTDTYDAGNASSIYLQGAGTSAGSIIAIGTGATSVGHVYACYGGEYLASHIQMYHSGSLGTIETGAGGIKLKPANNIVSIETGGFLATEEIRATTSSGLSLKDDGGNLGIFIEDGGKVGIGGITNPTDALDVKTTFGVWNSAETRGVAQAVQTEYVDWSYYNGSGWTYPLVMSDLKSHLSVGFMDGWVGIANLATNQVQAGSSSGLKLTDDSGTLGMFIEDGGKVGIGTDTPSDALQVSGTGVMRIKLESTDNQAEFQLDNDTSVWSIYMPQGSSDLRFYNAADRVVFKADGKVGIGEASPSEKLEVAGNLMLSGAAGVYIKGDTKDGSNNSALWSQGAGTSSHKIISLGTGATAYGMLYAMYGGTWTSNYVSLHHDGTDGNITTGAGDLKLNPTGNVQIANGKYLATDEVRARDSGGLYLRDDSGTLGIFIKDGGRVGFGTDVPETPFNFVNTDSSVATNTGNVRSVVEFSATVSGGNIAQYGHIFQTKSTVVGTQTDGTQQSLYGVKIGTKVNSPGNVWYNRSLYSKATHNHTTDTASLTAGEFNAYHVSTGTVAESIGNFSYSQNASTGTITDARGVRGEVWGTGAGTITNAAGVVSKIWRNAGTITTGYLFYGTYTGTVGTKWGIRLVGETKSQLDGQLGLGIDPSCKLDINSSKFRLRNSKTPSSAGDTGNAGDICWDASYIYVCTATNTWKRTAISTW